MTKEQLLEKWVLETVSFKKEISYKDGSIILDFKNIESAREYVLLTIKTHRLSPPVQKKENRFEISICSRRLISLIKKHQGKAIVRSKMRKEFGCFC